MQLWNFLDNLIAVLWDHSLGSDNAVKAYGALAGLSQSPVQATAWLEQHLRPAKPMTIAQVRQWIKDLDAKSFVVQKPGNDRAARQRLGFAAEPELRQALAANPPLEMRLAIWKALLAQAGKRLPSGLELRELRAVEVLERIGTPAARTLLRRLARGSTETRAH